MPTAPPAYQYCTGAVHVYAKINTNALYVWTPPVQASAFYLGTCEQYPLPHGVQHWEPTFNDLAGPVPFDKQYFGDSKIIAMNFSKFIQSNISLLIHRGIEVPISRGLFKNEQSNLSESFTLWLAFENFGTLAAIPGLPPGEIYFNCSVAETDYNPIGTKQRNTSLVVEADPAYIVGSPNRFVTYSIDSNYFGGLPTPS